MGVWNGPEIVKASTEFSWNEQRIGPDDAGIGFSHTFRDCEYPIRITVYTPGVEMNIFVDFERAVALAAELVRVIATANATAATAADNALKAAIAQQPTPPAA